MKKFLPAVVLLLALIPFAWRRSMPAPVASAGLVTADREAGIPARESERMPGRLGTETAAFWKWAEEYASAPAEGRSAMLAEGQRLALSHRARMKLLISSDPRRALEEALPVRLRQELPAEMAGMIEQRVNARGHYAVLGSTTVARASSPMPGEIEEASGLEAGATVGGITRAFVTTDGTRYEARVFGWRVRQRTTENAAVHGVALDGVLAVAEDPLRLMEAGERPRAGQAVSFNCPVSGKVVAAAGEITPETPAVELAGEVHFLCTGGHIHALREAALAAEGGTGGPSKPTGAIPTTGTTGVKSVLYIRVTFPEQWTDPQQEKDAYDMMKSVNDFFVENSHGALHLLTTVTPLLTMPRPESWYKANDGTSANAVLNDARAVARAAGFDYAAYDLEAVRYSGASGGFSGQAYVGGRGCWLKSSSAGVAAHEFGHNLGLWHANYWSTGGDSATGSGTNSEYGNAFDTMGSANAGNYFFNAGHQNDLGWIPNENVTNVTASGVYRLHQFDQARIDPASHYLLAVKKDAQRDYWCEFRQKWSTNAWLMNGVQVNWSPWGDGSTDTTAYGSNGGGQLLDTTPGSLDGKNDSPIVLGRTFSDTGAQVHITPVSKGGTSPESVDVVVNLGAFPGNQPPSLNLIASAMTTAVNESLIFTATSLDPDGDALAYSWDWGDRTFGANAAVATKSWSTAGLYTVRCEVSDMRGGTRSSLLAVTVGAPAQWRIGGRVLTALGDPVAGARVSCVQSGTTSTSQRLCLTDSDGNYLLSGLPKENYTLTAQHETHTLAAGFTNTLVISGTDLSADYTATAKPVIKMSLPDDSCTEAGDGAVLRFTRTAATNAGALEVRVFVGGSANMSDVDFAPVETYDLTTYKFTLPDGQASLDVAVTAFNDTQAEGPEVMTFYLVDGSGYIPGGVEHATLLVNDNDTTLPVVSLEAVDASATEGGDGATLRLSRTGPVDAAMVVSLTRSGTATTPGDYTGINTTATIPAGAASVDLVLMAVQDTAAEGTESATFSIASSATWIRAPLATATTVLILDDDIPVVTITAADAAASETNSDPAVFIVTRTGDFSQALSVDYATGGTAQQGTDYWPLSGTVTIPAGLATAALVITPVDDSIGEQAQTVTVNVRSTARYAVGAAFSATATIADNDVPHLMATVSDGSCDEAGGTGKFKIQSYGTGTASTTVFYTLSGTAAAGVDYAAVSGNINVPRSGFAEVTIAPLQDAELEDVESVVLTFVPDAAYTISPENAATLMIVDDDQPLVSVAASASSYSEAGGTARFYFSRNGATTSALTVTYVLGGTATAGTDYSAATGSIVIPAGAPGVVLDVALFDDNEAEGAESLLCTVLGAPGAHGANIASAMTWISDNDTASLPTAGFASASSTVTEGAGTVNLAVTLSPAAAGEVRVDYALESGSAFNGVDYIGAGGTLVFAPGETSRNIPVTVLDDIFKEPAENLTLRLVRASGAKVGASSHTITINDNDVLPLPVAGFATTASATGEGSGMPPLALVFLSAPQAVAVSLSWVVTGGTATAADAVAMSGTMTFQPGETAKPVPLLIVDDALLEPSETFVITLSAPVGPLTLAPQVTHTVTVADNDDVSVSITASEATASEGGDAGQFTIARSSANVSQPLTVLLAVTGSATAGDDYNALPASVEIPANASAVSLAVAPVDDAVLDPGETVTLSITPSAFYSAGAQTAATVTILDNETGIAVMASDALAAEPGEAGAFTITRSGPAAGELTVPLISGGTATPGDDYLPLPASITFMDGQTTALVMVTPVDDFLAEPDETILLTAGSGAGYIVSSVTAKVTLHDDDTNLAPVVSIQSPSVPSVFIPSGPGVLLDATVTDDGRPFPTAPPVLNWSQISGPGSAFFGNAALAETTVQFSAPGQYLLRLTAADALLSASANLSVFVLGDSLAGTNIGHASTLTGIAGGGTAWTLTGLGSTVGTAASDSCYFAHRQMSGDFTVIARVSSIGSTNASARCGVMVRGALTAGSRHAFASVSPNRSSFVWRTADGAAGQTSNTTLSAPVPKFVRLTRVGNSFTAAHSDNGTSWTTQGSAQTITLPDPVYVGLCAVSASTTATVVAAFDSFSLMPAGNVGAFVDAGPALSSGLNAMLAGQVNDAPAPAVHWEKLSGPGNVALPGTAAGAAVFDSAGTYLLRLIADDGEVRTFDDTSATMSSPFSDWQALHFGPDAVNPLIAGPRADPDFDGLENLAEYALFSDPVDAGTSTTPVSSRTATALSMTWKESTTASDVLIQPEWSADLAAWSSGGLAVETLATGEGWRERRATLDITARPRAALRLTVTLP